MARVFQRPGDRTWWIDYSDGTGRHRMKTTTTSKREAEDLLVEKLADMKRQRLGLEVLPDSRVKTVDDAWRMWLEKWCPEGSRDREQRRYNANVKGSWLAAVKLSHVSGEMLDKWFAEIVRNVRFHDLRHSTASHLLDKGVDLADVQQMLRHSTISVTEKHYRHRTVEALRRAVTKPSASSLERHLETLAEQQSAEVAAVLREAREKLALLRHQPSNVVPLHQPKSG